MSRTLKDKPYKLKHEPWDMDRVRYWEDCNYRCYQLPTTKSKKRKEVDTEDHWMGTPGWWIRLMMGKPQRRAGRMWEHEAAKVTGDSLEDLDTPNVSRKPHIYFW